MALPQASKKKIRARHARVRQRDRRGHDLRPRYRAGDLPATAHIGVVTVEDPYSEAGRVDKAGNLIVEAQLEPVQHADGSYSEGAPAWTPPTRPPLTAVVNLRQDPFGRLFARHKITEPQYRAGRTFQQLTESATLGRVSQHDLLRPRVDGGLPPDPISQARMAAAKRLRSIERTVEEYHGLVGLAVTKAVLVDCRTVEATARLFGADSARGFLWWGTLFRKCLDVVAKACGLVTSTRRPPRPEHLNGGDGAPDLEDPRMHADAGELGDPRLRQGRPNGG